jgi:DNA (cytosine-5)-methyltransferase 1
MYLEQLDPEYFWVENVVEFMGWGPLDENGKPVSKTEGKDYVKWIENVKSFGFRFDKKILNAADFGAYQSRKRYFAQFAKHGLPIAWPEQTHSKDKVASPLFPIKKWKAVRDVLDLEDEGESIFTRKKPLSENTLKRIFAGLQKFASVGEPVFTKRYNGGKTNPEHKVNSIDKPIGTILSNCTHALVNSVFLKKYYSGRPEGKVIGVDGPAGTLRCSDGQALVTASHFLFQSYGGEPSAKVYSPDAPGRTITAGDNNSIVSAVHFIAQRNTGDPSSRVVDPDGPARTLTATGGNQEVVTATHLSTYYGSFGLHDINNPAPTVPTKDRITKVDVQFIMNQFSGGGQHTDINNPAGTITVIPKGNLITANSFLFNPGWGGHSTNVNEPSGTVVASQHKAPLHVVQAEKSETFVIILIYDTDSPTMVKIKEFMCLHGILDIKMRMLKIEELLQIQGFPKTYKLIGTKTQQKKYIGNAVEVTQAKALSKSHIEALIDHFNKVAA